MSNYCTAAQVAVLLNKKEFSDSTPTTPTETQVTEVCAMITNEIDVILNMIGITAQPTDTSILGMLKKYASYGSACMVGMSYGRNFSSIEGSQPKYFCDEYKEFLKTLRENPEILGIIAGADSLTVSSNVLDGTYTEDEIDELFIDKDYKV